MSIQLDIYFSTFCVATDHMMDISIMNELVPQITVITQNIHNNYCIL